jgi:hypothetical protein
MNLQEITGGARAERGEISREEEIEKEREREREMGAAAVVKLFPPGLFHHRDWGGGFQLSPPCFTQKSTNKLKK